MPGSGSIRRILRAIPTPQTFGPQRLREAIYISTSTSVIVISGGPEKLGANRAITEA